MQQDGLFIAIEGIDGTGKETQCTLLRERLEKLGYDVVVVDFPRYRESSSYFIKQYLNGGYGTLEQVGPYTAALFYALDRYDAAAEIRRAVLQGKIVIANRFTGSNMAHQGAKISHPEERRGFFLWLDTLEFRMMNIPRPACNYVLQLPAERAQVRIDQKQQRTYTEKTRDLHEASLDHLRQTADVYLDLCQLFPRDFVRVDCFRNNDELTIEQVHELLWGKIESLLPVHPPKPANTPQQPVEPVTPPPQIKYASILAATAGKAGHPGTRPSITIQDKPSFYAPTDFDTKTKDLYQQHMTQILELHAKISGALQSSHSDAAVQLAQLALPVAVLIAVNSDSKMAEIATNVKPVTLAAVAAELQKNYSDESKTISLTNYWPRNELDILPAILYDFSNQSFDDIQRTVFSWPYDKKSFILRSYVQEPATDRQALDSVLYNWEALAEFQAIADLQSLGVTSLEWQSLSPRLGYEVPPIIEKAGLADDFERCFDLSLELYSAMQAAGYAEEAQYATLLGHRVRAKITASGNDLVRMQALSDSPEVHPATNRLASALLNQVADVHPLIAASLRPAEPAAPSASKPPTSTRQPKSAPKRPHTKRPLDK